LAGGQTLSPLLAVLVSAGEDIHANTIAEGPPCPKPGLGRGIGRVA
jgi:hypothetical protein